MVLLELYADWCGHCKFMFNKVLNQKEVISFVNQKFIPFKAESSNSITRDLMAKYSVRGFPTFIVLDKKGKELGRIVGSKKKDAFLNELRKY